MRPDPPDTKAGDVVIRYSDAAPSLQAVGIVLNDGDLFGSTAELFTGRSAATRRAYQLRRPGARIFVIGKDGVWEEVP